MRSKPVLACLTALAVCGLLLVPAAHAGAVKKKEDASVYVHCDGYPAHRSVGERTARALVAIATLGLAGAGEHADIGKRLTGEAGVAACTTALANETDSIRQVRLALARAVHNIEAKHYDAALADARLAPTLAGKEANQLGFRLSLLLSAKEMEAVAQARLEHPRAAQEAALAMAAIAPYDLIAQDHAASYANLTAEMTPEKKAFLDRYGPLSGAGLFYRPTAEEWAGQYAEAAADREAYRDTVRSFVNDRTPTFSMVASKAQQAVDLAMAGETARANALADEARKEVDDLVRSGESLKIPNAVTEAEEMLDLHAVMAKLAAGQIAQARAAFAARSRWTWPNPAMIADLTARLRTGAKPDELTGPLAKDPATIRADGLAALLGALNHPAKGDEVLYGIIRPYYETYEYTKWADDVRESEDSPFIREKTGKEKLEGAVVTINLANGFPSGDALLMHCAFWAKAHGMNGFVLFPARTHLNSAIVRFGNAGDPGFPARAILDAGTVIKALEPEFPSPKKN